MAIILFFIIIYYFLLITLLPFHLHIVQHRCTFTTAARMLDTGAPKSIRGYIRLQIYRSFKFGSVTGAGSGVVVEACAVNFPPLAVNVMVQSVR